MSERKYTLAEIKAAFWAEFHKSGECWFDYLGSDEDCESSTRGAWLEFVQHLDPEHVGDEP